MEEVEDGVNDTIHPPKETLGSLCFPRPFASSHHILPWDELSLVNRADLLERLGIQRF
jgi:hypothetical protein